MERTLKESKKFCECGCREIIDAVDKWGISRRYKNHHSDRGKKHSQKRIEKNRDARLCLVKEGKMTGSTHPSWKGGRWINKQGYVFVWTGKENKNAVNGRVSEHVLQLQKYLCRALTKDEIAHHMNGIKDDNRVGRGGNLQVTTRYGHTRYHLNILGRKQMDLSRRHIGKWLWNWRWLYNLNHNFIPKH